MRRYGWALALVLASAVASAQDRPVASNAPAMHTQSAELKLRQDMRKLWTDHVVWTRDYIIVADAPDAKAAADRLMKNQEDIGTAVAGFYGRAAGDKLTGLLKKHILIAVDLIKAAKAGDQAKQNDENQKWQQNGEEIAAFLAQ